jgi:nucleotide-binding universal stress UspA family protein
MTTLAGSTYLRRVIGAMTLDIGTYEEVEADQGAIVQACATVLCPIDFSDSSIRALEYALNLAEEADGRLLLLHAIEIPPELHEVPLAMDLNVENVRAAAGAELLERLRAMVPASARNYCAIDARVVEGKAHREILGAASREQSDLIVMGVQGRGAVDVTLFGSTTFAVVHGASCPVLTVRA